MRSGIDSVPRSITVYDRVLTDVTGDDCASANYRTTSDRYARKEHSTSTDDGVFHNGDAGEVIFRIGDWGTSHW